MAGTGAFVGREGELSRLQSALDERARLVLVVGDAGIGKTRFVAEGLRRATAGGMVATGGGCLALAEKLPLLPIADALDELSRLDGGEPFTAALDAAPAYVRPEVARLLPRLGAGEPEATGPAEGWRHERLFAAVAELLGGVARRSAVVLLIEDVHWADPPTLDFLTYLVRVSRGSAVSVVVTCRSDETPLDAWVADWLTHVRRDASVEEIRLGPLSRSEVAEQIAALVKASPPGELVAEVYARAEGHPFFTEQLVAAVTDLEQLAPPAALPARLAELLVGRTARCHANARAVLAALAVAGRPLSEGPLGEVTGLDEDTVLAAIRELTAARLLATPAEGAPRPRHALLAEAVATELLAGERVLLHERVARALETAGGDTLAAEAAGHWAAAGRSDEELRARLAAARAAELVFAYADAADHWQRAIGLCQIEAHADLGAGVDMPHLYLRAVDALEASGDRGQAEAVAEEAYRRFADHPDRATAALVHFRTGFLRATLDSPANGLPLIQEGLRLFEGTPPSAEHATALFRYSQEVLFQGEGRHRAERLTSLNRALEIAEAAGAATLIPRILCGLANHSFYRGEIEEGFRLLAQARSVPRAPGDTWAVLWPAIVESDALLRLGRFEEATRAGLRGVEAVRRQGFGNRFATTITLANAVLALIACGRIAEAAALIDPRTAGPVDRDNWPLHGCRAEIDLLRGEVDAAAQRLNQLEIGPGLEHACLFGLRVAEVALWTERPHEALEEVWRVLERLEGADLVVWSGELLPVGMRACADLAERSRARHENDALRAALTAADDLASWVKRERDVPFTEHPFLAIIPATRATWDAERSRVNGASDPDAWSVAAELWGALDYRHRAAYAHWRQAEALLAMPNGKQAAAAVLSTAAGLAVEHVPLMTAIQDLARRARIDLDAAAEPVQRDEPSVTRAFGLTDRESDVLRLLGQGKTNPEIAASLFISPRTAGVHVTHILRKLDATTRVQAATIAERAGLLAGEPTRPGAT